MQGYAIEHGVPESDIIIEPKARDTIENAKLSCQLIQACVPAVSNIGLLTTAFHIKRAEHLFKALLSENQTLHCFYVNDRTTRRENWWLTEAARQRVLHSYKTLQGFHAN
ncbi:hypothetical protein CS022_14030 [Veronia nyctiphanis]|uniref:DUF218 domain-containing protein n=2 Tax=Veronia nyctiphanis TaxID=1278244 RepID=A0A4Q0YU80_9GAMM|nr:hypothetical protein CS022_14030 [Veronia nyctiphanis]